MFPTWLRIPQLDQCVPNWTKEEKVCVCEREERERLDQGEESVCVRERDWTKEKTGCVCVCVCVCERFMSGRLCSLLYPLHLEQGMHKESPWKRFTDR